MRSLMAVALALAAACGSSGSSSRQTTPDSAVASDPDRVCRDEVQIGSSIPRPVCRTKAQQQDERDNAQLMLGGPHPKGRVKR